MAATGQVAVTVTADTSQLLRELREIELKVGVVATRPGSRARVRATEELCRFYTREAIDSARRYADLCPWWHLGRYSSRFRAWRYERELAR